MNNQKLINFLNQLLANYFVMYVKLHRYHWYIQGRQFFQLHEKFEEMYTMFASDSDMLAERILMINGQPLATMVKYIKEATLTEANADNEEEEMVSQLITDYGQIISEISTDGMKYATDLQDEPTVDLLITFHAKLEKYVWMLNAYKKNQ
jgi:starvation-inducible DNA-binding protein